MYQDFDNKKNEDYLDAFKQKVAEQKIATMEERRHEQTRSWNNFFGTLAGAVLAVAVGWFILMPQYKQSDKEVPTIHRPQTAVKVKPENPGGMDIPNQDKDVYNLVEKKEVDDTVVENLLPTPEEPKLPDIVPETVEAAVEEANEAAGNAVKDAQNAVPEKPVDLLKETAEAAKADAKDAAQKVQEKAEAVAKKAEEKAQQAQKIAKEEANKAQAKAKSLVAEKKKAEEKLNAEQEKLKAKAAEVADKVDNAKANVAAVADTVNNAENAVAKTVAGGKWQVQFVASKNEAAVEKTWGDLTKKYSMLQAYNHEIQKADLGAQGVVYRLRAGNFATREEASKVCSALKAKGMNDCIVKER